jgi:LmbE family N-acetylglucosaminyl deacetylase
LLKDVSSRHLLDQVVRLNESHINNQRKGNVKLDSATIPGFGENMQSGGMSGRWAKLFFLSWLVVLLGIFGALFIRNQAYNTQFHYSRSIDYQYEFDKNLTIRSEVQISKNGFIWPHVEQPWDTALLEMRLQSNLLGRFVEPHISATCNGKSVRQYFERGCSGVRYVNITRCTRAGVKPGEQINLHGHGVVWSPEEGNLILFHSGVSNPRVVVIAPHPDDAELAAFGFYRSHDSYIVTVTAGEYGPDPFRHMASAKPLHYLVKGQLRVMDSLTVPMLGNVLPKKVVNLGYFDNTLLKMYKNPKEEISSLTAHTSDRSVFKKFNVSDLVSSRSAVATWENLVGEIREAIRIINPSIIITPHPVLDTHPDHQLTTIALCQAISSLKLTQGKIWLYTAHVAGTNLYPFGPAGSAASLPPWHTKQWLFDQIYSNTLSSEDQLMKTFALEAMSDLRWNPQNHVKAWARDIFTRFTGADPSYFRRAIRADEIFFVVPFSASTRLLELFEQNGRNQHQG